MVATLPATDPGGSPFRLYGVPGYGSAITEAQLTLCGVPFAYDDVTGFVGPAPDAPPCPEARQRLLAVNPFARVPTLALPDGRVLFESVAITLFLAERFPNAGLAPGADDPQRPEFLRWLVWLVAEVYATFNFSDHPERFVPVHMQESFAQAVAVQRNALWARFETALASADRAGPWALGETFSSLDLYVAVMTRFSPRRAWFNAHGPRLAAIAEATDAHPVAGPVLRRNFPPGDGPS